MSKEKILNAARSGQFEVVTKLVNEDRSLIDVENEFKKTPIILAAENGWSEIVKFLVQQGANLSHVSKAGNTPLIVASEKGLLDPVKLMVNSDKPSSHTLLFHKNNDGNTALLVAAREGKFNVVLHLLSLNPHLVWEKNVRNKTALMLAVRSGNIEMIKYLLTTYYPRGDSRLNERDKAGNTAMHLATEDGKKEIVQLLLDHDADPSVENDARDKPICIARKRNYDDIFKLLDNLYEKRAALPATAPVFEAAASSSASLLLEDNKKEKVESPPPSQDRVTKIVKKVTNNNTTNFLSNLFGGGNNNKNHEETTRITDNSTSHTEITSNSHNPSRGPEFKIGKIEIAMGTAVALAAIGFLKRDVLKETAENSLTKAKSFLPSCNIM